MIEVDSIGLIFDQPENEEGELILLDGWHINTTPSGLTERPDLAAYVVNPSRLRRVWAGDDPAAPQITVALRFTDEAEARAILPDLWTAEP